MNVFGLKIYTRVTDSSKADATLGLYFENGIIVIKAIQNSVSGVSNWTTGIIDLDGIGKWDNGAINADDGGNIADPGTFDFTFCNVPNYYQALVDRGIFIGGCFVDIFNWFNSTTPVMKGRFRCGVPEVTQQTIKVNCDGPALGRVSNIITLINEAQFPEASSDLINNPVPAAFGNLYPKIDASGTIVRQSIAKFIRTSNLEDKTIYNNSFFDSDGVSFPLVNYFPIDAVYNESDPTIHLHYTCQMPGVTGKATLPTPVDTYVITSDGQIREVVDWQCINGTGYFDVYFTIKQVFSTTLIATGDTRTWVQFVKIVRNYSADVWPCKNFLDENAIPQVVANLYGSSNGVLSRIADFGFSISGSQNNLLKIDGSQFSDDINTVDSFLMLPIPSIALESTTLLTQWDCNGVDFDNYKFSPSFDAGAISKMVDGLYRQTTGEAQGNLTISTASLYSPGSMKDRDSTSYAGFDPTIARASSGDLNYLNYLKVLKFGLPQIPAGIEIDGIYLGIKAWSKCSAALAKPTLGSNIFAIFRRFAYNKNSDMLLGGKACDTAEQGAGVSIGDIMDQYFTTDNPSTGNVDFYQESDPTGGQYPSLNGYTMFKVTDNLNDYNAYQEIGLFFNRSYEISSYNPFSFQDQTNINEVCIIIKLQSQDISEDIYSPLSSRIFADTWGGRESFSNLIQKPKDLIEHICRLENFSESCSVPSLGWGYQYASSPLIDVSDFDNLSDETDSFLPALQILDEQNGYTDKVKQTLCRTFGLMQFIDDSGQETVAHLLNAPVSVLTNFNIGDVIDRNAIKITPYPDSKVFPNLQVAYDYDPVADSYNGNLQVLDATQPVYWCTLVTGFAPADAEAIWNLAHQLWINAEKVATDKQPDTLTNCLWANGDDCYNIALYYFKNMLTLMSCSYLEFDLPYNIGKDLQRGSWFNFLSIKHTNGVSKKCNILSIEHSNLVSSIKSLMLS